MAELLAMVGAVVPSAVPSGTLRLGLTFNDHAADRAIKVKSVSRVRAAVCVLLAVGSPDAAILHQNPRSPQARRPGRLPSMVSLAYRVTLSRATTIPAG